MKQEKKFLSDSDTVGIDGFWIEDTDIIDNITQTELQDRLNKAHAIGFKDGVKATDLIMKQQTNSLIELIVKARMLLMMANYLEDPQINEFLESTENLEESK